MTVESTNRELAAALHTLKDKKAPARDAILCEELIKVFGIDSHLLLSMSTFLRKGAFPSSWKKA